MKKFMPIGYVKTRWFIKRSSWQRDIKVSEYIRAIVCGIGFISIVTYLFYNSIWATILCLPLLIPYIKRWECQQESKLKSTFELQFKDYLQALASALSTGYALENAMKEARKDMMQQYGSHTRIMKDTAKMERLLELNMSVEQAWLTWKEATDIELLHQFTTVFLIAKKSGGDSVAIIKKTIANICECVEVETEIKVFLTAKRYEFQIMTIVPLGIVLYMKLTFTEFMEVLYGNVFGYLVMSICLVIYIGAFLWGTRIMEIEV